MGSSTTGDATILIVSGLEAEFTVTDNTGTEKTVRSLRDMGVKPNDEGSDLLGMEQLADVAATVEWDPANGSGHIRD